MSPATDWLRRTWEHLDRDLQNRATRLFVEQHRDDVCKWLAEWRKSRAVQLRRKSRDELVALWRSEALRRMRGPALRKLLEGLAWQLMVDWGLPALKHWPEGGGDRVSRNAWQALESLPKQSSCAPEQVGVILGLCCELTGARPEPVRLWLKAHPTRSTAPLLRPPVLLQHDEKRLPEPLTLLDQLLYREVKRMLSRQHGSLSHKQLRELLDELYRLNVERHTVHFHQGFMDASDTSVEVEHLEVSLPGFDEACREWRLAGMLAAAADLRRNLKALLEKFGRVFERASGNEAGRVIAFFCFPRLLENKELLGYALQLLGGQLLEQRPPPGGLLWMAQQSVDAARGWLRAGRHQDARLLLKPLEQLDGQTLRRAAAAGEEVARLSCDIRHCLARSRLREGRFQEAREFLQELRASEAGVSAAMLSDLGLACGNLKSVDELRVAPEAERRACLLESLRKGKPYFRQAVQQRGRGVTTAHHALSLLAYLGYWEVPGGQREKLSWKALQHAQKASRGMRASESAAYYEKSGLLGQSLFLQSVLGMPKLGDKTQLAEAYECWKQISPGAGRFPHEHVKKFWEDAALIDSVTAARIAESIWSYCGAEALEVLDTDPEMLNHSDVLQKHYLEYLRDERHGYSLRWKAAYDLLPRLLEGSRRGLRERERGEQLEKAVQVLDIMQILAMEQDAHKQDFIDLLKRSEGYDPAWKWSEAAWTRVFLLRDLGRDQECGALLRELFFKVRDQDLAQAKEILEVMRDWGYREALQGLHEALPETPPAPVLDDDEDALLRKGASLRIIFVGGDERQEPYDAPIREELSRCWPGVRVEFHHTGWTSNWGRIKDQLGKECRQADVVVLMEMMRTQLGRHLRECLREARVPWVPCTHTGQSGILNSLKRAALKALRRQGQAADDATDSDRRAYEASA